MPKEIQVSVSQITAHVARTICDDYCKYPDQYKDRDEDELWEDHCKECILRLITD